MKRVIIAILCIIVLNVYHGKAQNTKAQDLKPFSKISLARNRVLNLIESDHAALTIETKNGKDFERIKLDVLRKKLFIVFYEDRNRIAKSWANLR